MTDTDTPPAAEPALIHAAFTAMERLAPPPTTREEATFPAWRRHYLALALAAYTAFDDAVRGLRPDSEPGSRPDLAYLIMLAAAASAAAAALFAPLGALGGVRAVATPNLGKEPLLEHVLWDLSPGRGSLNGEHIDWLAAELDGVGVNPADIDPRFEASDFNSRSQPAEADR